jgi:hypothetical protein
MPMKSNLMVSMDSKPRNDFTHIRRSHEFHHGAFPGVTLGKSHFPAGLERVDLLQVLIYLPPSRPNSVLKISSHPPPLCRSLGCPGRCGSPFFVWLAWGRRLRSRLLRRQLLWSSGPRRIKARQSRRLHRTNRQSPTGWGCPMLVRSVRLSCPLRSQCLRKHHRPVRRQSRRQRTGIGKMPTPASSRSCRLVGILKAKNRGKAQATPSRTKEPRSGTADRTPWAVF